MAKSVSADQLIEKAQRETGLERFDSASFREGLDVLIADLTRPDQPEPTDFVWNGIHLALANRLKATAYLDSRPELLSRPIERPVFVFGLPRTGTTLLSNLLAADPNRRSPLTWEIEDPVPPPTSATLYDDPRALARLEQERALLKAMPEAGKYYRGSAVYPNECLFFTRSDFKGLILESMGALPAYREFLFSADMTSTYAYHKRFLQLLQADAPGIWNLKQPSHGIWLETLKSTYPGARLVWIHRDPFTATGSFCSLITLAHWTATGADDKAWIAQNMPWQVVQHFTRPMDYREKHGADSIIDVHYADVIRDPIATMRTLYAALGDDFTPEAQAGMQAWIDDNPQNKFGKHDYKLDAYGLSVEMLTPLYDRYLAAHDIEAEGI